jgi:hypothetical protein
MGYPSRSIAQAAQRHSRINESKYSVFKTAVASHVRSLPATQPTVRLASEHVSPGPDKLFCEMQHGSFLHCHSSATPATIQPTITLLHARITNCVIRFAGCRPAGVASGWQLRMRRIFQRTCCSRSTTPTTRLPGRLCQNAYVDQRVRRGYDVINDAVAAHCVLRSMKTAGFRAMMIIL